MHPEFIFVAVELANVFGVVIEEDFVEEIVFPVGVEQDGIVDCGEFAFRHSGGSSFSYDFVAEVLRAKDGVHDDSDVVRGDRVAVKEDAPGGF